MVGGVGGALVLTTMLNAGSAADAWPSLTLIRMLGNVPALELEGVPFRVPVEALNVAHDGRFWTLKVSVVPAGPVAAGVKEYFWPTATCVAGTPLMVSGCGAITWILKAAREADAWPSLTLMTILAKVPTLEPAGVPLRVPVDALNVAQDGRFWTLKASVVPVGPAAVGVNE
jgi:hypothetical protein